MTEREKYLLAKIASLEAENRRLFQFETALLQIRHILAAHLPPNRAFELRDVMTDIIGIVEETGLAFLADKTAIADEAQASRDANIISFPRMPRPLQEH
jgi:hypothetical protein